MINGYYEIYKRFPGFLTKAITLSFDDGTKSDRKMVEILNKYGIKCTFNLNSGCLDRASGSHITSKEIKPLYSGHEVASHTVGHPHLQYLDTAGVVYEVMGDRKNLEDIVGHTVRGFAYPYELCETAGMVDAIASCGIKYARTTVSTHNFDLQYDLLRFKPTCHQADPKLPELASRFFEPDEAHPRLIRPRLFYIWGHSYEYENNWEKLENMCRLLAGHDDVWYATNIEIFDYISSFDRLERSADGKYVYNPTDKTLYAVVCGKQTVFEAGKEYVLE